jgi:hypothetical protein
MGEANLVAEGSGVVAPVLAPLGVAFCGSGPETRCGPSAVLAAFAVVVPFRGVVAAACALGFGRLATTSSVSERHLWFSPAKVKPQAPNFTAL